MNIANRLKKLELNTTETNSASGAKSALLDHLESTFTRLDQSHVTEDWMKAQSNSTALALALFGPLPLRDFLHKRVSEIAQSKGAPGKLAALTLEAVRQAAKTDIISPQTG